jgi:hypothetical protein
MFAHLLYDVVFFRRAENEAMLAKISNSLILRTLCIAYILTFAVTVILKYRSPPNPNRAPQVLYNNYLIYTQPFGLMLEQKTAYADYPDRFEDRYRYSPTFAFLMGAFHFLPVPLGIVVWSLLGTMVLLAGIFHFLKEENNGTIALVLAIAFFDALGSAQHMQANNLLAGMILLGVSCLRDGKPVRAALIFALCGYVKFYGMAAAIFFLFAPHRLRFLVAMVGWLVVLWALPLTIVPLDFLLDEYKGWFENFAYKVKVQLSVMGVLASWFNLEVEELPAAYFTLIEAAGLAIFLAPLLRFAQWSQPRFQRLMLASFLIFVVIFNPTAEQPTYVYATVGVALWFVFTEPRRQWDYALLAVVILFTSLSGSDIMPVHIKLDVILRYRIKAVPCILVFIRLQYLLWRGVAQPLLADISRSGEAGEIDLLPFRRPGAKLSREAS